MLSFVIFIPEGAPVISPIIGVTFVVPVYATILQMVVLAAIYPIAFAANVIFSLVKKTEEAEAPLCPSSPFSPSAPRYPSLTL